MFNLEVKWRFYDERISRKNERNLPLFIFSFFFLGGATVKSNRALLHKLRIKDSYLLPRESLWTLQQSFCLVKRQRNTKREVHLRLVALVGIITAVFCLKKIQMPFSFLTNLSQTLYYFYKNKRKIRLKRYNN